MKGKIMINTNNLMKSPIYHLSMCSQENFYTCFLTWLGNKYPKEVLKALTDKNITDNTNIKFEAQVDYGKNIKLDLQITIEEKDRTEYVVLENKLKSYPAEEQLLKYTDCFKEKVTTFLLLSLAPTLNLPKNWQYISYCELADKLTNVIDYKTEYDKFLVEDFINTIKYISVAFPKEKSTKYDFYETNELDKIGLKDTYIKYRTSELTNIIKQEINNKDFYVGCSFHNKKGTIDIVKEFSELNFNIGIQIEQNQYRYFMNLFSDDSSEAANKLREDIATKLLVNDYWFSYTNQPIRTQIYKNFCGYKPCCIYRYFDIKSHFDKSSLDDVTYQEITEQIKKDIQELEENTDEIIRIYKLLTDGVKRCI